MLQKTAYNREHPERQCPKCGAMGKPYEQGKFNQTHGYALACPHCHQFIGWGGKAKPIKDATKRIRSSNWTDKRLGIDYCQCCMRNARHLGNLETLEIHHVIPVADGGTDSPENLWVLCTACHKAVHARRTYTNDHMHPFFEAYDAYQQWKAENQEEFEAKRKAFADTCTDG